MVVEFPIRSDKLSFRVAAKEHLASVQSPFQRIDVYDTPAFGRILLLDGHVQLSELDERGYHEALVWPTLASVAAPRQALIVGGGDGGAAREICRHAGIERLDMVEIDEQVVAVCREHLPGVSAGAFEDPRLHLTIGDAFGFVRSAPGPYDIVVVDCTDVYEDEKGGLSEMLFTDRFYADVRRILAPGGFVVTQADNPVFCPYSVEAVREMYARSFDRTGTYWSLVPSFGGFSAFVWGSVDSRVEPAGFPAGLQYLNESSWAVSARACPWPATQ